MLFLLAQTVVAPVTVAPPAPPPIVRTPRFAPTQISDLSSPERRVPIEIAVRGPDGPLWTGSLIVAGRGQSSSWTQSRSEPADPACAIRGVYHSGERDALNLTLNLIGGAEDPAVRVSVTARWARRADAPCGGTRTVELSRVATLPDRAPVLVRGDGGLVVELRRR